MAMLMTKTGADCESNPLREKSRRSTTTLLRTTRRRSLAEEAVGPRNTTLLPATMSRKTALGPDKATRTPEREEWRTAREERADHGKESPEERD